MKKFETKNISIQWKFKLNEQIKEDFSNRQWAELAQKVVDTQIKRLLDKGLSPVAGFRMFQKYKNPEKYPGDLKSQNKPNLHLSGSMLSNYQAREGRDPLTIDMGIFSDAPEIDRIKAKANNEGTETAQSRGARNYLKVLKENAPAAMSSAQKRDMRRKKEFLRSKFQGIVARRFIPIGNETYTRQILLELRKAFSYCLKQALQKGRTSK